MIRELYIVLSAFYRSVHAFNINAYICYMSEINRIKAVIESMRPELTKRYHINRIGLFGAVVTEDFLIEEDDVDIIVDFKKPIGDRIMDLTELLETKLNAKVSLITKGSIDKEYLKEIKKGIQYV